MKKGYKYLIGLLTILAIIVGFWYVRSNIRTQAAESTENSITTSVAKGNIQLTASGAAVVQSSEKKDINSITNGKIEEILVSEGQEVYEGDLLLLFENSSTSSEIERLMLDLEQQQSELSGVYETKADLNVYAPISGYIGNIAAEVGNDLNNGFKVATITNSDKLLVNGYYVKGEYDQISIGDRANVTVDAYMTTFPGTVVIKNQTPQTRGNGIVLYEISVALDNAGAVAVGDVGRVSVLKGVGEIRSYETSAFSNSDQRDVIAGTSGKVTAIRIKDGDYIDKGELLLTLESSSIDRQISSQQNSLERISSEISEKYDILDDYAVYSPISGVVTSVNVAEGEQVGNNNTLFTITDLNNLEIVIPVDELQINEIQIGMPAQVTVGAASGKIYIATVSHIGLEGISQNGVSTFDVTLKLDSSENLKPGMSGDGVIVIARSADTLLLPIESVQTTREGSFVIMADAPDGELTPVKIGLVSESFVEILEGVSEGDSIKYFTTSQTQPVEQPTGTRIPGMGGGIPGMGGGQKETTSPGGGN
ncbi:MAG: efflux RND transporter periplasmic adaptor subunit [Bacillota bacterium]